VLGGAGYVKDWPVEQLLRDCRVFTIFEGTSGIQALDLLHRRLRRDEGKGLRAFLEAAEADLDQYAHAVPEAPGLRAALDLLKDASAWLEPQRTDAPAYPFLKLAACAALGWSALRLAALEACDPTRARLAAAGRAWLLDLEARAAFERAQIELADARVRMFEFLRRPA
jgi:hypothetical protein